MITTPILVVFVYLIAIELRGEVSLFFVTACLPLVLCDLRERRLEHDSVVVSIGDDGPGIPEHVQPRIFEQFFTTKPVGEGTGQGLAIAKRIIATHGGRLSFGTTVGQGTTFFVRLPLEQADPCNDDRASCATTPIRLIG